MRKLDRWSQEYHELDHELGRKLKIDPWYVPPTVVWPNDKSNSPPGSAGWQWETDLGPRLFEQLCAAAGVEP